MRSLGDVSPYYPNAGYTTDSPPDGTLSEGIGTKLTHRFVMNTCLNLRGKVSLFLWIFAFCNYRNGFLSDIENGSEIAEAGHQLDLELGLEDPDGLPIAKPTGSI